MNFKEHMSNEDIKKRLKNLLLDLYHGSSLHVYKDFNPPDRGSHNKGIFVYDTLTLKSLRPIKINDGYEYIIKPYRDVGPRATVFLHRSEEGELTCKIHVRTGVMMDNLTHYLYKRKIGSDGTFIKVQPETKQLTHTQKSFILITSGDQIKEEISKIMKEPYFFPALNDIAMNYGGSYIRPNDLLTTLGLENKED